MEIVRKYSDEELILPEEKNCRIPTLNHSGFMFTQFDPLVMEFIGAIEKKPHLQVLEVGGAYGNVAEASLEKGALNYCINDLEEKHLALFAKRLIKKGKSDYFSRLKFICGRCPDEVKVKEGSLDAILANKVLPFFTPQNVDSFFEWAHRSLKAGGCVYLLTLSTNYRNYHQYSATIEERKKKGERFPGYIFDFDKTPMAAHHPTPQSCPKCVLTMDMETLEALFVTHGFKVEKKYTLATIGDDHPQWTTGEDMLGMIASKKG